MLLLVMVKDRDRLRKVLKQKMRRIRIDPQIKSKKILMKMTNITPTVVTN